ncbi:uncharacterized protein YmfQ (DUF2313 family) [Bosea sp. OAE506]|uniref:hypothetical protein n=1 Tax=Bosea sp. OAE506 TaxID=2663870 RepID=UPI00178A49D0
MTTSYCHSDATLGRQIAAYRPRGDAWRHGGHDGIEGSVMGQVFAAFGAAMGPTERRLCALIDEFFCSSAVETLDLWALDYGVPDGCDPFADVCEKVNAVGDSTPEYAEAAALRRGWSIAIAQEWIVAPQSCVMGIGQMGAVRMGAQQGVAWRIAINLAASPAYAPAAIQPLMGLTRLGLGFNCPPDVEGLRCLVRRIAPAHADLIFTTV